MLMAKEDEAFIQAALRVAEKYFQYGNFLSSPSDARSYLALRCAALEHEEFGLLWLNNNNAILKIETMFRGTISQTAVYPREIVKAALSVNASAVILFHNHPSGQVEPSQADIVLTKEVVDALKIIDVRVLDHIILGGGKSKSLAELGLV